MLKLIKHDFISTGRIMGIAYAVIAALTLFIFATKKVSGGLVSSLGAVGLVFLAFALFIFTAVVLMVDFHKSLYCDRGYLTFTLPVKSWKILLSKIIVSGAWLLLALAAFIGTGFLFLYTVDSMYGEEVDLVSEMVLAFSGKDVGSYIAWLFAQVILLFIEFCCIAIVVSFANTLSNVGVFQKHPVVYTLLFSALSVFTLAKISDGINKLFAIGVFFVDEKVKFAFNNNDYYSYAMRGPGIDLGELFVFVIVGVGVFFLTHWLMSKKVNIK